LTADGGRARAAGRAWRVVLNTAGRRAGAAGGRARAAGHAWRGVLTADGGRARAAGRAWRGVLNTAGRRAGAAAGRAWRGALNAAGRRGSAAAGRGWRGVLTAAGRRAGAAAGRAWRGVLTAAGRRAGAAGGRGWRGASTAAGGRQDGRPHRDRRHQGRGARRHRTHVRPRRQRGREQLRGHRAAARHLLLEGALQRRHLRSRKIRVGSAVQLNKSEHRAQLRVEGQQRATPPPGRHVLTCRRDCDIGVCDRGVDHGLQRKREAGGFDLHAGSAGGGAGAVLQVLQPPACPATATCSAPDRQHARSTAPLGGGQQGRLACAQVVPGASL
jgi:hypothetical protein